LRCHAALSLRRAALAGVGRVCFQPRLTGPPLDWNSASGGPAVSFADDVGDAFRADLLGVQAASGNFTMIARAERFDLLSLVSVNSPLNTMILASKSCA